MTIKTTTLGQLFTDNPPEDYVRDEFSARDLSLHEFSRAAAIVNRLLERESVS